MEKVEGLRVIQIEVRDVLGAREVLLEPGQITMIEGENESGKTSVLRAIEAALGGGVSLARLARIPDAGEETTDDPEAPPRIFPEVVLVLEDPAGVHYRVKRDDVGVSVERQVEGTEGYEDLKKPAQWLSRIWDGAGANPVAFVRAPSEKERTLLLLESLPLEFQYESFIARVGLDPQEVPRVSMRAHPLEAVGLVRDAIFERRKGVNRDQKAKVAAADQTRRKVPVSLIVNTELAEDVSDQERLVTKLVRELGEKETQARADRQAAERAAVTAAETERVFQEKVLADAIAIARADFEDRKAHIEKVQKDALAGITMRESAANGEATIAYDAALEGLKDLRAEMMQARSVLDARRSMKEDQAAARALHEQAAVFEAEGVELGAESERLTAILSRIDVERAKLAENIPIEGLEIVDGAIVVGGIPFNQLNTAQQWRVASQVACLRAQDRPLKLVLIDGAEALDAKNQAILIAEIKRLGAQAIMTMVSNSKRSIWTEGR